MPQSLEVTGRDSPSTLTIGWAPAAGPREGYRVSWHQEGSQSSPGGLVNLGPDNTSLMLRDLVPGSCYTVSVWTRAGNLSSSIQRARACTREFPAVAPGRPALGSGVGTNILHTPSSVCLTQAMHLVRIGYFMTCLQAFPTSCHWVSCPPIHPSFQILKAVKKVRKLSYNKNKKEPK